MNVKADVRVHDTPAELFDELARWFPVEAKDGHRWVSVPTAAGFPRLTFFAKAQLEGQS